MSPVSQRGAGFAFRLYPKREQTMGAAFRLTEIDPDASSLPKIAFNYRLIKIKLDNISLINSVEVNGRNLRFSTLENANLNCYWLLFNSLFLLIEDAVEQGDSVKINYTINVAYASIIAIGEATPLSVISQGLNVNFIHQGTNLQLNNSLLSNQDFVDINLIKTVNLYQSYYLYGFEIENVSEISSVGWMANNYINFNQLVDSSFIWNYKQKLLFLISSKNLYLSTFKNKDYLKIVGEIDY